MKHQYGNNKPKIIKLEHDDWRKLKWVYDREA